jgi:Base plate wedge protein 53
MATNNLYPATSPYSTTGIVNNKFLDVMVNRTIPMNPSDIYWEITTVYEYRPDLLAYDLYADSRLWWVFAQRNPNRLKDPYFDFVTGTGIYIPKLDLLRQILGI